MLVPTKKIRITSMILFVVTLLCFTFPILAVIEQQKLKVVKTQQQAIKIVTTTTILQDAVKHLIGEVHPEDIATNRCYEKIYPYLTCETLMGVGVDPHNYKTKLSDRNKIKDSDLMVINGLHLEAKMTSAFETLAANHSWNAGDILAKDPTAQKKLRNLPAENIQDPHIWFDIDLFRQVVKGLKERLDELFEQKDLNLLPEVQTEVKTKLHHNYCLYEEELLALKDEIIERMRQLAQKLQRDQRQLKIVTAHDAFRYLEQFLCQQGINFELIPVQGISTQTEASAKTLASIIQVIIANRIKVIFVENTIPSAVLKSIQEGVRDAAFQNGNNFKVVLSSDQGLTLYSDSLGLERDKITWAFLKQPQVIKTYPHSSYIGAFLNNIRGFLQVA